MANFCSSCGLKRKGESKFCTNCGHKFQITNYSDYMLSLLSLFRKPRELDNEGWQQSWSADLQTPYIDVINQFIRYKDLVLHSYTNKELFNLLTIEELKRILKSNNLKVSGKKQVLIDRLVEAGEIGSNYVDQSKFQHYVITDQARNFVKQYLENIDDSKKSAESEVSKFIQNNEFSNAYGAVMRYKHQLPSSMRGEGLIVGISFDSESNQPNSQQEIGIWRRDRIEAIRKNSQSFPKEMTQKAYEHLQNSYDEFVQLGLGIFGTLFI